MQVSGELEGILTRLEQAVQVVISASASDPGLLERLMPQYGLLPILNQLCSLILEIKDMSCQRSAMVLSLDFSFASQSERHAGPCLPFYVIDEGGWIIWKVQHSKRLRAE